MSPRQFPTFRRGRSVQTVGVVVALTALATVGIAYTASPARADSSSESGSYTSASFTGVGESEYPFAYGSAQTFTLPQLPVSTGTVTGVSCDPSADGSLLADYRGGTNGPDYFYANTFLQVSASGTTGSYIGSGGDTDVPVGGNSTGVEVQLSQNQSGSVTVPLASTDNGSDIGFSNVSAFNGSGTISISVKAFATVFDEGPGGSTAGNATVSSYSGSVSGGLSCTYTYTAAVAAPPPASYSVSPQSATPTAGVADPITITAKNAQDSTDTAFNGTATLSDSPTSTGLPASLTFTNGVASADITFNTAGEESLKVEDSNSAVGTSSVDVQVGPVAHVTITVPPDDVAGMAFNATLGATDAEGNTVTLTASDTEMVTAGADTCSETTPILASCTVDTAGAGQTARATIDGVSDTTSFSVAAAPAASLSVNAPSDATAGSPFDVTETVTDAYGNTVAITGTPMLAGTNATCTAQSTPGDFSCTDTVAGPLDLTGSADGQTGATNLTIKPAAPETLAVAAPDHAQAGTPFDAVETVKDSYGNTVPISGTPTMGGGSVVCTAMSTPGEFSCTDNVAEQLTLQGDADGVSGSTPVDVVAAPASTVTVTAPTTAVAGQAFAVTETVTDPYGNSVPVTGTPTLTGTNSITCTAQSDAGDFLCSGTVAGPVVLTGDADGVSGQTTLTIEPGAPSIITVTAPTTATAGVDFAVTEAVTDAYGNSVAITGTPTLTGTNATCTAQATAGDFSCTDTVAGPLDLTGSADGQSGPADLTIEPAAAAGIAVSAPSTAVAGQAFAVTETVTDAYGNVVAITGTPTLTGTNATCTAQATAGDFSCTDTVAGPLDLTGSADGQSGPADVTIEPGAPESITVTAPTTATAGVAFAVTEAVTDAYGNSVAITGTPTLTGTNATCTAQATAGDFSCTDTVAGPLDLTGTADGQSGPADLTIEPAAAAGIAVSAPSTAVAGQAFAVTETVTDAYGNVVAITGTPTLTGTNATCTAQATAGDFSCTDNVTGPLTLTGSADGESNTADLTIEPAAAHTVTLTAPSTATAGVDFAVTEAVTDAYGNSVAITGTPTLTGTNATCTAQATAGDFSCTDNVTGPLTLTGSADGESNTADLTIEPAAAHAVTVSAPSTAVAAAPFAVTETVTDAYGNVVAISGTPTLTGTNATCTAQATAGDFSCTDNVAGPLTLTGSADGESNTADLTIEPGAPSTLTLSAPATTTAGIPFAVTETVTDASANVVPITGTPTLTGPGVTCTALATAGEFSCTEDTAGPLTLTGTADGETGTTQLTVNANSPSIIVLTAPASAVSGADFTVTVHVTDSFGNPAPITGTPSVSGTIDTTDPACTLTGTTSASTDTFACAESTSGTFVLTAHADGLTTTATTTITAGPAATLKVTAPTTATAGSPFPVVVIAVDANGNTTALPAGTTVSVTNGTCTVTSTVGHYTCTVSTSGPVTVTAAGGALTTTATVSVAAAGSTSSGTTLPFTGFDALAAVDAGVLAILCGAGLFLTGRRRRARRD